MLIEFVSGVDAEKLLPTAGEMISLIGQDDAVNGST